MSNFTHPINFSNGSHCTRSRNSVFHSNWRPQLITPLTSELITPFPLGPSTSAHWPPGCTYCLFPVPGAPTPESPVALSCLSSGLCLRVPLLGKLCWTDLPVQTSDPCPSHSPQPQWWGITWEPASLEPCSWGPSARLWIGKGVREWGRGLGPSHLYCRGLYKHTTQSSK